MPDEEPGHTYDEVRYEEHRAKWAEEEKDDDDDEVGEPSASDPRPDPRTHPEYWTE